MKREMAGQPASSGDATAHTHNLCRLFGERHPLTRLRLLVASRRRRLACHFTFHLDGRLTRPVISLWTAPRIDPKAIRETNAVANVH